MMKLAVVVTENYSAWNFRREMLRAAVERGIDTYLITPSGAYDEDFRNMGVQLIPVDVDRVISPVMDLGFCLSLYRIFSRYRFDTVHNVSIKPNIYGAFAARLAGIGNIVGSVTGLGNVYMDEMGMRFRMLRPGVTLLYRAAFRLTDRVWFQNPDDAAYFIDSGMLDAAKAVVIRGSGVNTRHFSPAEADAGRVEKLRQELKTGKDETIVSMFARALRSKGIEDFMTAARIIARLRPEVRFLFIGDAEPGNPLSLTAAELTNIESGNFDWLGWRHDVREILQLSDIVVLPSRYREGIPKSLLEAMSMGKPIITTDVPGCREVVRPGDNGFLVPPADPVALATAIGRLSADKDMRKRYGTASRRIAEEEFDIDRINSAIIEDLYHWKNAN